LSVVFLLTIFYKNSEIVVLFLTYQQLLEVLKGAVESFSEWTKSSCWVKEQEFKYYLCT